MAPTPILSFQHDYLAAQAVLVSALEAATDRTQADQASLEFYATIIAAAIRYGVDPSEFIVAETALLQAVKFNQPPMTDTISTGISIGGQSGPDIPVNFSTAADANALVGPITVSTNTGADYAGVITLSGADAGKFALSNGGTYPCDLLVGTSNIPAGTYSVSLTATP